MRARSSTSLTRDRRALPVQVADAIRELVDASGLGPGGQLPTEADLAARFGVARTTVREALKLLEQDGLINVHHGRGRFLSTLPRLDRPVTRLESVTEMMAGLGRALSNRVVSVQVRPATPHEAEALELEPGAEIVTLERVRLQEDDPLIYSVDVLPASLLPGPPGAVDWSGSLFELLDGAGINITTAVAQLRAVTLPLGVTRRLGLPAGQAWQLIVHRNLAESGRPAVYSHDYYRGDQFTFNVLRRRSG